MRMARPTQHRHPADRRRSIGYPHERLRPPVIVLVGMILSRKVLIAYVLILSLKYKVHPQPHLRMEEAADRIVDAGVRSESKPRRQAADAAHDRGVLRQIG